MNGAKWKKWMAGVCTAAMIAGVPAMTGYATMSGTILNDYTNTNGGTTVNAEVVENINSPSYAVIIPTNVDFGQIQQPTSDGSSYATTTITVKCESVANLEAEQAVGVFVKDSTMQNENEPFLLTNDIGGDLQYEMINSQDLNIQDNVWYSDGYLYAAFTNGNQESSMTLRLDKVQLYGKDLSTWGGEYTGKLNFATKIVSIRDVQSMSGSDPVVW